MGLGAVGVGAVDGFVDARDDYGGVAGELAGCVDGVPVPSAARQAGGAEKGGFGVAQDVIEVCRIGWWSGLERADGCARSRKSLGGGEGGGEVELHLRFCGALLSGVEVALDLFAVEIVVVGQDVGVGHVEDFETEDAGLLLLVDKGGIAEFDEPVVVVEDGVVDAVGAAGADVGGGDAEVLDEGSVV